MPKPQSNLAHTVSDRGRLTAITALTWLCASIVPIVHADFEFAEWISNSDYHYQITGMPDYDQERGPWPSIGLPNNGEQYCVPTSMVNLFRYGANHGFPGLALGQPANYGGITTSIRELGSLMNTDPDTGTKHGPGSFGALVWITASGESGKVVLDHAAKTSNWVPRHSTIAQLMQMGGIVNVCYGRYDVLSQEGNLVFTGPRNGGHCTTIMHVQRDSNGIILRVRDPADGGSIMSQSPYRVRDLNPTAMNSVSIAGGVNGPCIAVDWMPGNARMSIIDSYYALRPMLVYDWESSEPHRVRMRSTTIPDPLIPSQRLLEMQLPSARTIRELVVSPDETFAVVTMAGSGTGWEYGWVSLQDGTYTELGEGPVGTQATIDRFGDIFVTLPGNMVHRYDRNLIEPLVGERTLPEPVRAVTVVDEDDTLMMYAPSTRTVLRIDRDLPLESQRVVLPPTIPTALFGRIAVDPSTGFTWIQSGTENKLHRLQIPYVGPVIATEFEFLSVPNIEGFDFDDGGRLFLTGDGSVKEFHPQPDGTYLPAQDSPSGFNGLDTWSRVTVSRSNNMYDEETMSGPEWDDIPAGEVEIVTSFADCPGDVTGDDIVDLADLNLVLGNFGQETYGGDTGNDGTVNLADLNTVLANFGNACE